jgi:hypothetical protein
MTVRPLVTKRESLSRLPQNSGIRILLKFVGAFLIKVRLQQRTLCVKTHVLFCLRVECNSLNVHRSESLFEQNLHRKIQHLVCVECVLSVCRTVFEIIKWEWRRQNCYYMRTLPNLFLWYVKFTNTLLLRPQTHRILKRSKTEKKENRVVCIARNTAFVTGK